MIEIAGRGHQSETGFVAKHAAEGGRKSDGAADIGTDLKRGEAGGDRGSGTTR